jgi:hypothetical protein
MAKHEFRVIDTCPCPKLVAPYIYICLTDAKTAAASIYRGDDARHLLNKYGHHSQYQLVHATPAERVAWDILGTPDPVGESTHELKSDGEAYPAFPIHADLLWWMQGFDVPTADSQRVIEAAARRDWVLFRPYKVGVEIHHLCFLHEPKPHTKAMAIRIKHLRSAPHALGGLPRS